MVERRGRKKGPNLVYQFQQSIESGDASNEEASPCDPKSNNQTQKERSKAISMLVDTETADSLKRRAVMVIAKKIGLACADLLYYKTKNIHFLLCTSMAIVSIIISSEFFCGKKLWKKRYLLPSILTFAVLSNVSHFWNRNIMLLLIPFGRSEVNSLKYTL